MIHLAQKYQVDGLKNLAIDHFVCEATQVWDRGDFLRALDTIYRREEVDEDVKLAVCQSLCQRRELLRHETVRDLLQFSSLAYDLLMYQETIGMERVMELSGMHLNDGNDASASASVNFGLGW